MKRNFSFVSKIPWKPVIIGIIGISVAFGSVNYQKKWLATHQETVLMPIVQKDIPQNAIIGNDSIEMKPVLKAAIDPTALQSKQDILGKVAVSGLVPGEQVRREKLASPDYLLSPGEALVCVRTDKPEEVLGGQITPGKYVNVVWMPNQNNPPQLLARNAKIVALEDENMHPISTSTSSSTQQGFVSQVMPGQQTVAPRYVLLRVKENESYDFARPLSGGFVSLVQVTGSPQESPQAPLDNQRIQTQQPTQQPAQTQQQSQGKQSQQPQVGQPTAQLATPQAQSSQ